MRSDELLLPDWRHRPGRASTVGQGVHNATELMDEFNVGHLPYYVTEYGSLSSQSITFEQSVFCLGLGSLTQQCTS